MSIPSQLAQPLSDEAFFGRPSPFTPDPYSREQVREGVKEALASMVADGSLRCIVEDVIQRMTGPSHESKRGKVKK
jgi:hypothetical protein